ncbi:DNA ligase D [Mucilaginibacter rubeus]|uniref:DNA ligase (ATP) n=1 Tax=Mucilaginibacter rubeus TaxID=2027860 RepID=A0AAE6JCL5_9SPHI|nr:MULTISPECIES: DNA ligase D [Mucilaginibacter]QEM03100.1 DNA ligase D [Mucilaginibacter rubeus]QEM15718.1 DNA ligase D [Mucilaginibacter gossypii]QTE41542.1 DNA ligase D [Mucilaginibacter rubeus]QTE48148.1 DNA ligase D [Mucilaginibacter rubeus]QTE59539.1 DNA ligase D [Mucilaginibacter rubeus]
MKIATYNINGINGRLEILLRWLNEAQPDVVCLQELKCENSKFPERPLGEAGYQAIWHGQKSWNGVAILSKTEIRELRNDLPGEDEEFTHSRYIEAFINGIVVGCIYLPNGNPYPGPKFDYKLRWFQRLAEHAQDLVDRDLPVILVGDYNVMPTELDTYKPEKYVDNALFRVESRDAYKDLVAQGWTDAIRALYPNERIYTFWDYLRDAYARNAGLRLDHFLLNKKIAGRLAGADVDKHVRGWKGASDHAPVWIELADNDLPPRKQTAFKPEPLEKQIQHAEHGNEIKQAPATDLNTLLKDAPSSKIPADIKPMKATLVDAPFDDPGWIYEIKWDGYRAVAIVKNGTAELISRNNLPFDQFRPINDLLESWQLNAVLDGEIVALNEQGNADFGALQNWRNSKTAKLAYFVFDILWYDGKRLTDLPLYQRREILKSVLPPDNELIRVSQAFEVNGIEFFEAAKKMKLEGIIAKRADSTYSSDARSREWLKIKAKRRQEVVVAGFTKNEGTGKYFSALAIGVYDKKGVLRYIGKVGTGFNDAKQREMMAQFKPLITAESPFDVEPDVDEPSQFRPRRLGAKATWLKPELVCEVEFAEITGDGKVRQASFKGMRSDKNPKDVVLELEADTQDVVEEVSLQSDMTTVIKEKPKSPIKKASKPKSGAAPANLLLTSKNETEEKKVEGHLLKFTHLNKVYWPEDGVTKRDMFNYYHQVAPVMVPYLKDRPMSLNRFPGGIHGESFYQKNVKDKAPDWAKTMPHTNGEGVDKDYLLGNDEATLLWMASLGCIEMNPWFSRAQSPDNPDYCVIDLDPDKQHFDQVIQAAQEVKNVLDAIDVPSYPKTSGSTGMHIYIPLGAKYTYDQSQLFANIIVKLVHKQIPDFTTLERMISNRNGKMYLDFLQNRPGATIAGVYSLRPKPGATVSMPVCWDEVKPGLTMRDFTIHNAVDRIRETGDLFKGVLGEGIDLARTIQKAQAIFTL